MIDFSGLPFRVRHDLIADLLANEIAINVALIKLSVAMQGKSISYQ